jgi:YfiH family protein
VDVAEAIDVTPEALLLVHQVHGSRVAVRRLGEAPQGRQDADAIITNDPAVGIAIQSADCVPLLMADRRKGHVAAVHAGWRGLAAGAPATAVDMLAREFGSASVDLVAAIGPSIGACCYEVGAEVRDRFRSGGFSDDQIARWFHDSARPTATNPSMSGLPTPAKPAHWFFDAWAATRDALEAAAIPPRQIHVAGLCTGSHAQTFCSYRRDGKHAGRMAAAIRCVLPRP